VFTDKLSGSAKTVRPGLVALLDYARPGDSVVIARKHRLLRSQYFATVFVQLEGHT
jgi:DNA invertase Pin-like site-specific DNA recombinase